MTDGQEIRLSRALPLLTATALLTASALPASAEDAWQAFWDRCLHPVSNVIMPNTEGLSEEGRRWMNPDEGWGMEYDLDRGEIFSCSVTTENVEATLEGFRAWAADAVESEAYMELPASFLPDNAIEGYESNLWREPRIQVYVLQKKTFLKLVVEETDFEAHLTPLEAPPHA